MRRPGTRRFAQESLGCRSWGVKLPPVLRRFLRGVMPGGSGVSIVGVKIIRVEKKTWDLHGFTCLKKAGVVMLVGWVWGFQHFGGQFVKI